MMFKDSREEKVTWCQWVSKRPERMTGQENDWIEWPKKGMWTLDRDWRKELEGNCDRYLYPTLLSSWLKQRDEFRGLNVATKTSKMGNRYVGVEDFLFPATISTSSPYCGPIMSGVPKFNFLSLSFSPHRLYSSSVFTVLRIDILPRGSRSRPSVDSFERCIASSTVFCICWLLSIRELNNEVNSFVFVVDTLLYCTLKRTPYIWHPFSTPEPLVATSFSELRSTRNTVKARGDSFVPGSWS